MSESQDIRAWAKDQGIDLGDRGRIPAGVREQYDARNGDSGDLPDLDGDDLDLMPPDPQPAPAAPPAPPVDGKVVTPERRPQAPRKPRRKLFERKPKTAHKRVSIDNLVSAGWQIASVALAHVPEARALPVARVLSMQAPVAGIIVDDLAKGTLADRILQPFARAQEKSEKAFALVGPPLLVGVATAQPQMFPMIRPLLKASLMSWMLISKPAMEKAEKRARQFAEDFGEVDIDGMIDALWADLPIPTAPSEQEEENIRKARGG